MSRGKSLSSECPVYSHTLPLSSFDINHLKYANREKGRPGIFHPVNEQEGEIGVIFLKDQ